MSPDPELKFNTPPATPITEPITQERCEQILAAINRFSLPIVQQITDKDPTHKFGREKYDHMHELASKDIGAEISELASLPAHEQLLLKIILRAHDLGRHIEALRKLGLAADTQWELASEATENDLLRSEKRQHSRITQYKFHSVRL